MPLYQQLLESIQLGEEKKIELSRAIEDGSAFFYRFNTSRMNLAFSSFSEDMKKALFEVIYFLHVNDPKYEDHTFTHTRIEKVHGVNKEVPYTAHTSLYVKGSPAGVVGIEALSTVFKQDFDAFIQAEFKDQVIPVQGFAPIYSISSLGSIGTVGHKRTASDLDLQVQYELSPFLVDPREVTDEHLKNYANSLIKFFAHKFRAKKGITPKQLKDKKVHLTVVKAGKVHFRKRFPLMFECVVLQKREALAIVFKSVKKRQEFVHEIISLVNMYNKAFKRKEILDREKLLKLRIDHIQDYVQKKYPKAEVFLFAYSNDDYRDGKHGTTLESKEASGSAYELILNYETLMPGIQFTPMIPIHFLMPPSVNSSRENYERLVDYIRFHFTTLYDQFRSRLVDLGATPPITLEYMIAHSGAIYWESFKASSGNLPKALLNLLRIEMLFDQRFNTSIIELVKNPKKLDVFASAGNKDDFDEDEDEIDDEEDDYDEEDDDDYDDEDDDDDFFNDFGEESDKKAAESDVIGDEEAPGGFPLKGIFMIEDRFPLLLQDPWWLRYKALKIAFSDASRTIKDQDEKDLISRIIDLCFALHIRISDVFKKPGGKKEFETHREKVMADFLAKAFPRSKRRILEHVFIGEVDAVLEFERNLKFLFKRSMDRVNKIVEVLPGKDQSNREEYRIWYHYYETNFDPPPNVVRRDILNHLKVPRGRLQIGYNKGTWFFKSLQKSNLAKSHFDTFGMLDHLPDEVELFEHKSFLHGIAHCILNGYYGVTNKGTLLESRTHLEFSIAHMKIGKASADKFAYIRPDNVVRLTDYIDRAFPPQEYDYRDCILKEREISNIYFCLNLLEYGRLSVLYRDNLKTWFVDLFDHPEIEKKAYECYENPDLLLHSPLILKTIKAFFEKNKFVLNYENKGRVHYWVNPNSVRTHHSLDKTAQKEKEIAVEFGDFIYRKLANK